MTDLQLSIEKFSPPVVVAADLTIAFKDFFAQMEQWEEKAATLNVEDETQTGLMFEAGVARKALASIRVAVEKQRKAMKEDSLRTGQAIDGVAKMMRERIEAVEAHLAAQENFIVNREAARIESLRSERYNLILPYLVPEILPTPYPVWGEMHEDDFQATLHAAQEKARQIEADRLARIAKEKADAEELERLRKEQAEKDELIAKALAAQRDAERELAEARRINAQRTIEQVREALDTPTAPEPSTPPAQTDREKLRAYGAALLQAQCAPIQDKDMRKVLEQVKILLVKVDKFIEEKTAQ